MVSSFWKPAAYRDGTLYDAVRASAQRYPDRIAYKFMGKSVTYRAFLSEIDRAATALVSLGVEPDEIVCLAMPNVPQAIIFFYAVNRVGAVANMIHPLSSAQELRTFVNRVHAKTILIMDQFYDTLRSVRAQTELKTVIVAGIGEALPAIKKLPYALGEGRRTKKLGKGEPILRFREFLSLGRSAAGLPDIGDRTDRLAVILHSGGTTGKIKGVCHSNRSLNASAVQTDAAVGLHPGEKMLSVMPIFHGNGLITGIHLMLLTGGCCVLIPRFSPSSYVRDLLKNKCDYISAVPTLFEKLMEAKQIRNAELSFLHGVFSGGDCLSVDLQNRIDRFLREHHSPTVVRQGYGMTEGVAACTLNPETGRKLGSAGVPLPDVTLKIVEPGTDRELPCGEVGEIVFSSVTNMIGYYEDADETALVKKLHADGRTYIHSGDLGSVDADGFLFFRGRIKRMIVTNGYNVFPLDLENTIERHPAVKRCCVIGVPDPVRMEKTVACIVLREGFTGDETMRRELDAYFRRQIARYAVPREIRFLADLPRTRVGKVDYAALIGQCADGSGKK